MCQTELKAECWKYYELLFEREILSRDDVNKLSCIDTVRPGPGFGMEIQDKKFILYRKNKDFKLYVKHDSTQTQKVTQGGKIYNFFGCNTKTFQEIYNNKVLGSNLNRADIFPCNVMK